MDGHFCLVRYFLTGTLSRFGGLFALFYWYFATVLVVGLLSSTYYSRHSRLIPLLPLEVGRNFINRRQQMFS